MTGSSRCYTESNYVIRNPTTDVGMSLRAFAEGVAISVGQVALPEKRSPRQSLCSFLAMTAIPTLRNGIGIKRNMQSPCARVKQPCGVPYPQTGGSAPAVNRPHHVVGSVCQRVPWGEELGSPYQKISQGMPLQARSGGRDGRWNGAVRERALLQFT